MRQLRHILAAVPKKVAPRLEGAFAELRAILEPYATSYRATSRKDYYGLVDNSVRGWSIDFAAVVWKRTAVSFYYMAAHEYPDLLAGASGGLMARRTKAGGFFNFKEPHAAHTAELARLLAAAHDRWDAAAIAGR